MDKAESSVNFMQIIPSYQVSWDTGNGTGNVTALTCAIDDVQALIRSIMRSKPTAKITIEPVS